MENKLAKTFALLIVVVVFVASCATLPSGQVKGVLIKDGGPLSGWTVFLGSVAELESGLGPTTINTDWQTKSDASGNFLFEEMSAGKYTIIVFSELGGFEYVLKGDEKYIFELSEAKGVDLGRIDATNTQPVR